ADLPGEDHTAPDPARARDADLGDDDRVLADLDVVRDLHEVVDLGAAPHDRVAEHRAIDRRVGSDLHVVLDEDPAHLRDLAVRLPVECVAEAVGPDHRARMDDGPPAELDAGSEHHARLEGLGELTEGEPGSVAHRRRYFLPLFTACWSYALMISSVRSASGAA